MLSRAKKCLNKRIGSVFIGTRRYNFQLPILTLSPQPPPKRKNFQRSRIGYLSNSWVLAQRAMLPRCCILIRDSNQFESILFGSQKSDCLIWPQHAKFESRQRSVSLWWTVINKQTWLPQHFIFIDRSKYQLLLSRILLAIYQSTLLYRWAFAVAQQLSV